MYDGSAGTMKVKKSSKCCGASEDVENAYLKARDYVSRNWSLDGIKPLISANGKMDKNNQDWDKIIDHIYKYSFSISAMAFQDVWNLDIERVRDCCIHVVNRKGKLIPFCLYNISDKEGKYLYRE